MIPAHLRAALHQSARRRGLRIRITGSAVAILRPAYLPVQVLERTPAGYRERPGVSKGLELLAELPTVERARAWLCGFSIRQGQEMSA